MSSTWVVVTDSSRARFFLMESRNEPLTELEDMMHATTRLHEREIISDRQGNLAGGHGEGGHAFEAPTDLKQHELEVFAKQIADKLEQGRINHSYRKLILVAPPAMLGMLRQKLNAQVMEMVSSSLDKNLVDEDVNEIRQRILA